MERIFLVKKRLSTDNWRVLIGKAEVKNRNKVFNYRIYPVSEQEILINKTVGCVQFVYHKLPANHEEGYEQFKEDKETLKQLYAGYGAKSLASKVHE